MKQFEHRVRGGWLGVASAASVFVLLMSVAFAGGGRATPGGGVMPVNPRPVPLVTKRPLLSPAPAMTLAPGAHACAGLNLRKVVPGTRVPLSCLPHLPQRSSANTVTPTKTAHGRYRPFAATGATVDLTAGAGCGSSGALYSVGCSMTWQAENNTDWASSTYQDYLLAPNTTTATATGGTYANNASTAHTTTLSVQGTYAFFVYDTLNQVIISIVYVNTGAPFSIGVYQDPYHTQAQYQFNVLNNAAAYIYMPDVSTTDVYVVYVESTAVNTFCVFITPGATPAPPSPSPRPTGAAGSLLCNPTTSAGVSAPSGTLALQWPLSSNYPAGTYSIVVYNATTATTIGQVQVSLTGFSNYSFQLYPTPGANPSPAAPATPPATIFAWDSATEQSTSGIVASVGNLIGTAPTNGVYRMTATDPDGQVVEIPATNTVPNTCTFASNSAANCIVTGTFKFSSASPTLNNPGNYPSNTWTMQLYAPAGNQPEASQYFQIDGYSVLTQFDTAGAKGQTLNFIIGGCFPTCATIFNQASSMIFTNNANVNYPLAADPIKGIEWTTGAASTLTTTGFKPPTDGEAGAYGTTFTLTGCTGTYNSAAGCSKTVTDSTGGSWTATAFCSIANPANPTQYDASVCVLQILPNNNNNLPASASITVPLVFYAYAGNDNWTQCYAICQVPTSILPQDGLSWSNPALANSPAYAPVYIGGSTVSMPATAGAHFIGSNTDPGNTSRNAYAAPVNTSPPQVPWVNTHFYESTFAQGEYQNSTPFQAATGREDILMVNVSLCIASANPSPGCTGANSQQFGPVEITLPLGISASSVTVDPSEPAIPATGTYYVLATSGGNACQNTPPSNAICLNPGGTGPTATNGSDADDGPSTSSAANAQAQIWLDVPATQASYIASEMSVQVYSPYEQDWFPVAVDGHTTTPIVGGGVAGSSVDALSLQGFSLNSNFMATQFNPTTVSPGATTTTYTLDFTNTSTSADVNPDPVDGIVVEQTTSSGWTLTAPSFSGTGSSAWTTTGENTYNPSGNTMLYYFGVCNFMYSNRTTAEPPQPPTAPVYPTTAQTTPSGTTCTPGAQELDSIAAGGSMDITFSLADTTTGTKTFYVYAHGANGGGWSAPRTVTVVSTAETGSAKFFSTKQGATDASCSTTSNVATNTVATVSKSPVCFIYEVSNTSKAGTNIGTVDIALPAYDINGLSTTTGPPVDWSLVGSPITQYVVLGTISGGTFTTTGIPAGCAINAGNTSNPVPGSTAGNIEVSGCTGLSSGANIAVEFVANTPQTESDSYLLPTKIDGATSGLAWTGSDEISVAFSLGLAITVDPGNPGPGLSHPSPVCSPSPSATGWSGCAFSGATIDFGQIAAPTTSVLGTDTVRATVVYEGSTIATACNNPATSGQANTWQLYVSLSTSDPQFGGLNELFTSVDETNSSSGTGLTYASGVSTLFAPTTSTSVLGCGPYTASTDFDVLQNFQIAPNGDTASHSVTVVYTLIGN